MLRKLRIVFSALCGIFCLLLIALLVRSYWRADDFVFSWPGSREFVVHSMRGTTAWYGTTGINFHGYWTSEPVELLTQGITLRAWYDELLDISLFGRPVILPHWMFVAIFAILAVMPWLKWRFSLRTLLVAMTLFAAILGVVVYAVR